MYIYLICINFSFFIKSLYDDKNSSWRSFQYNWK